MKPFLDTIAERLLHKFPDNMQDVKVVLPSKRSVVFLKHYLSKKIKNPIFLPEMLSIEEFIVKVSGLEILDNISLQFKLYNIYFKDSNESFDKFLNWSNILLNDFNDIDKSLADAKMIYTNLSNIKELEKWGVSEWSLSEKELTSLQHNYLDFSENMYKWYKEFRNNLLSENLAYQGLAYSVASKKITETEFSCQQIWFVGLNALTISEQNIIDYLKKENIARVFWDADNLYYNNPLHEAGSFLRTQRQKWHEIDFKGVGDYWSKKKNSFNVISCPKDIAQAKVTGELLNQLQDIDIKDSNTAIVLSDESLLMPVLHNLPKKIKQLNVTMGSPLKDTVLFSFFKSIFNMQINAFENNNKNFYYQDIIDLLDHTYSSKLVKDRKGLDCVKKWLVKENKILIDPKEFINILCEYIKDKELLSLFILWTSPIKAIQCLESIIDILSQLLVSQNSIIESEVLVLFHKIIILLKKLISEAKFEIKLKILDVIFHDLVAKEIVSFKGEPLEGVQLMGILESRTLDFKNVIMLSVNEGVLPKGKSVNSFITYAIKKKFQLPTYSDRDAVFSYHFYRLLQRANNISLIYNSETDDFGNGEKSRFITQLLSEYKSGEIKQLIYKGDTSSLINRKENKIIIKNKDVGINSWMEKGVSPSAINKYNNCSLAFYYHYLINVRPELEVEEFADSSMLGTFIHKALEESYPIGNLSEQYVRNQKKSILNLIEKYFAESFPTNQVYNGKNYISLKVAQRLTSTFLDSEIKMLQDLKSKGKDISILFKEKEVSYNINVNGVDVKLSGIIDRVDAIGDTIRIIDYKTGRVDRSDLIYSSLDELMTNPQKSKAFQLAMYLYLFIKTEHNLVKNKEVISGIISFQNISSGFLISSNKSKEVTSQLNIQSINDFEKQLKKLLSRIISNDFTPTDDVKSYEWRDYNLIYKI